MRQRVSIARAFAGRPDILLCDEPFSALDEHTGNALRDEFRELLRETGATGIFITHSIDEALRLGGRLIVFERPARIAYEARSLAGYERRRARDGARPASARCSPRMRRKKALAAEAGPLGATCSRVSPPRSSFRPHKRCCGRGDRAPP